MHENLESNQFYIDIELKEAMTVEFCEKLDGLVKKKVAMYREMENQYNGSRNKEQ